VRLTNTQKKKIIAMHADGVSQSNKEFDWFNFFDDIMEDSDFFSDSENMQLFITFAQKIKAP
jgi:hypothetical protein